MRARPVFLARVLAAAALMAAAGAPAADRSFEYGLRLYAQGDYYRAITELDRFRFMNPLDRRGEDALWLEAMAYLRGERWIMGGAMMAEFLEAFPDSPRTAVAAYLRAYSLYRLERHGEAAEACGKALALAGEKAEAGLCRALLACIRLSQREWLQAAGAFDSLGSPGLGSPWQKKEDWAARARRGADLRPGSVPLAVVMSMALPGSGQAYSGRPAAGLGALALVGGAVAGALLFHSQGRTIEGNLMFALSGVLYLGNLQSAALAMMHRNERAPGDLEQGLVLEVEDEMRNRRKEMDLWEPVPGKF